MTVQGADRVDWSGRISDFIALWRFCGAARPDRVCPTADRSGKLPRMSLVHGYSTNVTLRRESRARSHPAETVDPLRARSIPADWLWQRRTRS
ncbi:hypothetical protein BLAT2472_20542 [Burkholderia latens]